MMTYNPRYYPRSSGTARACSKVKDLYSFVNTADGVDLDKIGRVADRALKRHGVTVRPVNMKDFQGEVSRIWDVYNAAWEKKLGLRSHDERRVLSDGKGDETDPQTGNGSWSARPGDV